MVSTGYGQQSHADSYIPKSKVGKKLSERKETYSNHVALNVELATSPQT